MASLPAQNLGRLFFPLLGIAVLIGTVAGTLTMTLLLVPDGWSADTTPFVLFLAAVFGALASIPPVVGAAVAVGIQGKRHLPSSGNRQSLVAALGATVGAIVPALTCVAITFNQPNEVETSLWIGASFILVCFCLALATFRGMLSFVSKRQKQPA
ncbi:hypothetical protein [Paeniglutamicibacter kerguelensis]|uniref:Uncharacterized protein n=1 Tax=Paeniglutamicibacter kerguelensis TaxID=254788 RepID=A0ABS4XJJ2_9MICC|nr:hypothetical protein [Paeniglutamicibacter kerguelensis]MBP2388626.1 hypothetical protein [Paeniglutamicibacter kerguelensis]